MRAPLLIAAASVVTGLIGTRALATDYRFVRIADTRDGPYFLDLNRHPAINNAGSVAFWRQHTSGGGIGYFIGNGGAQNTIVLNTNPALTFQDLHQLSLNDGGDIAFYADSLSVGFRVYKATSAGTLSVIAASGGGSFSSIDDYPTINNSGAVAFKAGSRAFVNAGSGNLEYYGPTTPAGAGVAVGSSPFISNAGQLALSGSYGLATNGNAYLRGSGGPPTIIADGATTITSFGSKSSVNDGGMVCFGTTTSGPGGNEVIYTGMGFDVLTTVADNSGPYAEVAYEDGGGAGGNPAINNSGTVAFVARLTSGHYGIFTGADPSTTRVVQAGSTMFGRTLTDSIGGLGRDGINNKGEIGFAAGLFDGSGVSSVIVKAVPFAAMKWDHNGDGSWSVGGNWLGPVPNAYQHDANFTNAITAPSVVTVDGAFTVGSINFDNANRYTVSGSGSVTLDDSYGGQINDISGSHTISARLILARDATISVSASNVLTLSGAIDVAAGKGVTKIGAGTAEVSNIRAKSLTINAGTVKVIPNGTDTGTSRLERLDIAYSLPAIPPPPMGEIWLARLDLADNNLVIDYDSSSPAALVRSALISGYGGGAWTGNGITSSAAAAAASGAHETALGYLDNNTGTPLTVFRGQSVDSTCVLIGYVYSGDANLDRIVDTVDFNLLAASFSQSGKVWFNGDFDYNGTVDTVDFNLLASNFSLVLPAESFGSLIPEPSTAAFALAALLVSGRRRRSDRRHAAQLINRADQSHNSHR